ncbi:MAG: CvpA family protein [Oscillospiraceae bacterium]|nr:CvpA family protein [Oscillospiraceae bacterium]
MIFDIIIISLFVFITWRGWHKGGIKTVFGFLTYLVSFIIAFSCRNFFANFFMQFPFAQKINDWVTSGMNETFGEASKLPFISSGLAEGAENLTFLILQIISIIIVFVIVALVLGLVARILTKIIKVLRLGILNRVLGGIVGAAKGYILIYIITLLSFSISGWWPWLAKSMIGSLLINNLQNPITLFTNIWRFFV